MASEVSRKKIVFMILIVNMIVLAATLFLPGGPGPYFKEGAFVTYFSSFQLVLMAALAGMIFWLRRESLKRGAGGNGSVGIWILMAIGLLFLSLDEVFLIHENIDFWIHRFFQMEETSLTDRIDDLIVGGYGVLGLTAIYIYRKELKRFHEAYPLFFAGFVLMFFSVGLDLLTARKDLLGMVIASPVLVNKTQFWLDLLEDSVKVLAEAVFLGSFYYCLDLTKLQKS